MTEEFRRVRLLNMQGKSIGFVRVPSFHKPPEAIFWGIRAFFHVTSEEYMEGTIYVISHNAEVDLEEDTNIPTEKTE